MFRSLHFSCICLSTKIMPTVPLLDRNPHWLSGVFSCAIVGMSLFSKTRANMLPAMESRVMLRLTLPLAYVSQADTGEGTGLENGLRYTAANLPPQNQKACQGHRAIVASFPAVKFGTLHYSYLERDKIVVLKLYKGNFEKKKKHLSLSVEAKAELQWWVDHVECSYNGISSRNPDITVSSGASLSGWGCECEVTRTGGPWLPKESKFHINYLELKAVFFFFFLFAEFSKTHVLLRMDYSCAVARLSHMCTSHSESCNELTLAIWEWCTAHRIWLTAAFLLRKTFS